ncbi:hypothetical protein [Streptomyces antimicrobicus]|uniref:Uncharacterized protein n=1 Tax=Streptomyces antimicrobicus TaxID=2883108 RepID=A0ABS8BBD7_9ACTN|nr:hypothetical protein [Streptomyces antimicrobicus]MCB5181839.1 hypothetical protein [Streptomyces antimicrobicus]
MERAGEKDVFVLPRGATGFRHISEPELPRTGVEVCRAAWQAAARAAGGEAVDFMEHGYPQSFHSGSLTDDAGPHVAVFHANYPYVAFVDERRCAYSDEFLEPPAWAAALCAAGFTVLGAAVLRAPLDACDTSALGDAEWSQIEYWEPPTLGALLFNMWD